MIAFTVTVRREGMPDLVYPEIAHDSSSAVMHAQARFGVCRVFVRVT
ncbi:hypothetical protein [Janthinobacterium sp. 75]|nr:hypothetical protein [Janthinobacterium sp. 75]TDY35110.1 hypothetical protein C8C89_2957 [Janthinobacterium sp. 75]